MEHITLKSGFLLKKQIYMLANIQLSNVLNG